MLILGIDPGPIQTGWAMYSNDENVVSIRETGVLNNDAMLDYLQSLGRHEAGIRTWLAIEMITSYGMPVGREVFETCVWIGRYQQAWHTPSRVQLIPRREVKEYLCGNAKAKDTNVRAAIIEMFPPSGAGKCRQIGVKGHEGPLYGVVSHAWAALGVALTHAHRTRPKPRGRINMAADDLEFVKIEIRAVGPAVRQARYLANKQGIATDEPNPNYILGTVEPQSAEVGARGFTEGFPADHYLPSSTTTPEGDQQ